MKTCSRCGQDKPLSEYYCKPVSPKCKACVSDDNSKAIVKKKSRRRYWMGKYKTAKGCQVCGFNKSSAALDWHHVDPTAKEQHITKLHQSSLKRLFAELKKCVVLCANCHRMVHSGELHL